MPCVRIEEGTATLGYKTNSSTVGDRQTFPSNAIDGYCATE
jgi:hypothetical protein